MNATLYLAAPLCSEAEREFNLRLNDFVGSLGFSTYLPQVDGGHLSTMVAAGAPEGDARAQLFIADCDALRKCDGVLALLDGRSIDEGACFELGFAFALGKRCIAFKTDSRSCIRGRDNLMIEESLLGTARTWGELETLLRQTFTGEKR